MSTEIARRTPSLAEQKEYARSLATAGMLPKQYRDRPGDILLAMAYAESLNLPVAQVFSGIHVIEGRPSMSAELMNALIRRAGHRTRIEQSPPGPWVDAWASFTITRTDDPEPYTETFTMRDALQAKLLTITPEGGLRSRTQRGEPTPWENYPKAMLKARAISAAARAHCADVLAGVSYTPEEVAPLAEQPWIEPDPEPTPAELATEATNRVRVHHGQQPVEGPAVVEAEPTPPAEGDHPGEAPSDPQNASQPVDMSDSPPEQPIEGDPPAEVDWRIEWHERLNSAGTFNGGINTTVDLGNEAAANGDSALVELARKRYREIAAAMDDIARDGS